jgi:hypothetical protein
MVRAVSHQHESKQHVIACSCPHLCVFCTSISTYTGSATLSGGVGRAALHWGMRWMSRPDSSPWS